MLPLYHVGGLAVLFRSALYGTAVSLHPRFDLATINHDLDTNPITLISLVPTMLHRLLQSRTHWPVSLRLILLGGAAATPELVAQANALPRKSVIGNQYSVISGEVINNSQFTIHNSQLPLVAPTYGLTDPAFVGEAREVRIGEVRIAMNGNLLYFSSSIFFAAL